MVLAYVGFYLDREESPRVEVRDRTVRVAPWAAVGGGGHARTSYGLPDRVVSAVASALGYSV